MAALPDCLNIGQSHSPWPRVAGQETHGDLLDLVALHDFDPFVQGTSRIAADACACHESFVLAQHVVVPDLMTTKTVPSNLVPVSTAMLEQIAELDAKSISPETVRHLLSLVGARARS